uniref:Uncharacterized protein n=1 Tax=Arundo donax TaxID=35708 RepID=A0A0A8ZCF7_ARUDO
MAGGEPWLSRLAVWCRPSAAAHHLILAYSSCSGRILCSSTKGTPTLEMQN